MPIPEEVRHHPCVNCHVTVYKMWPCVKCQSRDIHILHSDWHLDVRPPLCLYGPVGYILFIFRKWCRTWSHLVIGCVFTSKTTHVFLTLAVSSAAHLLPTSLWVISRRHTSEWSYRPSILLWTVGPAQRWAWQGRIWTLWWTWFSTSTVRWVWWRVGFF